MKADAKIHIESLMNIPLVRQMLADPSIEFSEIGFDARWSYSKYCNFPFALFNPHLNTIYYCSNSAFSKWLKMPEVSARKFNDGDQLLKEVCLALHDYLHIWAYQAIRELVPRLEFGIGAITNKNYEEYVFCHLLTEAVATVGLDYWYLCQIDMNEVVPIGTLAVPLTVGYSEKNIREIRRFNPNFSTLNPEFFKYILNMYLTGEFLGFNLQDQFKSPMLKKWISHELFYGEKQRIYTRLWLKHLSSEEIHTSSHSLDRKVEAKKPWQKRLANTISKILYDKVVNDKQLFFSNRKLISKWISKDKKYEMDFRFINISFCENDLWSFLETVRVAPEGREHLFWQIISRYNFERFDRELINIMKKMKDEPDLTLLKYLVRNKPLVVVKSQINKDMFMLA